MKVKVSAIPAIIVALISLALPACHRLEGKESQSELEHHKIVVTSPKVKDILVTEPFVCQIRSRQQIEVRALNEGYLEEILIKEGQTVKQGEVMFRVMPNLYQAKLKAEAAEYARTQQEYNNNKELVDKGIISPKELALYKANMDKALAMMKLAETELSFTQVRAPFDGIVDRQQQQLGSLVKKEEILTNLYDNTVMWVYFNVPEAWYLNFKAGKGYDDPRIELVLADGSKFSHTGCIGAITAKFNNEVGTIPFRADFPNPEGLLRHGQTGNVLIHRTLKNVIVIPQRATFEILNKQYVYVIGKDNVVHQHEIVVEPYGLDDIFVVKSGLDPNDRIVFEGVRQVREGEKVEYEFRKPEEALENQKNHAE